MIREVKRYRGKVTSVKMFDDIEVPYDDWFYGGLIYDEMDNEFLLVILDEEDGKPMVARPDEDTICMSTFTKDIKSETIFENDILNNPLNNKFYIVVYDHGVLGLLPLERYKLGNWGGESVPLNMISTIQIMVNANIVGNIIDVPDWVENHSIKNPT